MSIGSRFRLLLKDFAIYGTSDFLARISGLITLPIYTRIFLPKEYGAWSVAATLASALSALLILGGNTTYSRFYFDAKTKEEKILVTSTWFIFLAIWVSFMAGLLLPFSGFLSQGFFGSDRYRNLIFLSTLTVPLTILNLMFGQILRNEFLAAKFSIFNLVSNILAVGCSLIGALTFHLGLSGVVGGIFAASAVMLPIRIWDCRKMLGLYFSFGILRNMLAYSLPLVPMSVAYWIFGSSDRFLLNKLSSPTQVGLYAVANNITSALAFLSGSLGQAWAPHALEAYQNNPEEARHFFGQSLNHILAGFGLLCVGLTVFSREILLVLSTAPFYSSAPAIGPLALGAVAMASTQITALGISLSKKTYYFINLTWLAAILNVLLNVLLIPKWGMLASSWATAVSYAVLTLSYAYISQKLWPIAYDARKITLTVTLVLCSTIASSFLPTLNLISTIALKITYVLFFVGCLAALRIVNLRDWIKTTQNMIRDVLRAHDTAEFPESLKSEE